MVLLLREAGVKPDPESAWRFLVEGDIPVARRRGAAARKEGERETAHERKVDDGVLDKDVHCPREPV